MIKRIAITKEQKDLGKIFVEGLDLIATAPEKKKDELLQTFLDGMTEIVSDMAKRERGERINDQP